MNPSDFPKPWLSNCKHMQALDDAAISNNSSILNHESLLQANSSEHLIPKITKRKKDVTQMFENTSYMVVPLTARERPRESAVN